LCRKDSKNAISDSQILKEFSLAPTMRFAKSGKDAKLEKFR
jgi:hypothetical protein